jgi:hypothetical protein
MGTARGGKRSEIVDKYLQIVRKGNEKSKET